MMLKKTYYEINRILSNNAEPLESVRLVETYRQYFKPETVRVVLLQDYAMFSYVALLQELDHSTSTNIIAASSFHPR